MCRVPALAVLLVVLLAAACKEGDQVTVHAIAFNGVKSVDVAVLKSVLATREDTKIPIIGVKLPWSKQRNSFDRTRFEADLQRIRAFYADRGYPSARVVSSDVTFNKASTAVNVTVTIEEGEPTLLAAVVFNGFDVIPPDALATLRKQLPIHIGRPRDRQALVTARDVAVNTLRDHGYPYAQVATSETVDPSLTSTSVVLAATPGPLSRFGPIEIAGNKSVRARTIQRQLLFKPGDPYRRSVVQETQRRLYGMALFQFVNIELVDPESLDPVVKTRITVAEGKHQRVNAGIGYGTEEKARVDAEYRHVNFLGGARTAGVHGRWSSLDRGARFDFEQPYFFAPSLTLGAEAQQWYTFTPAYESKVSGARVALTRRVGARQLVTVSLSSEHSFTSIKPEVINDPKLYNDLIALGLDPTTGTQQGTLGAVGFTAQRATTDNVLDAHRGYQVGFQLEEGGRLLPGTFDYDALSADARFFLPISPRLVLANRLQMGNIHAAGGDPTRVPFSRKYFLGGATSLRGWGRYEVSPLGGSGLPIGGNTMAEFSSELRAVLRGSAGGVIFLDAGNVWSDLQSARFGDLRYSVGTGFRYQTPIGPVRLDVGYQLTPIEGLLIGGALQQRRWRLHFSIGQAF